MIREVIDSDIDSIVRLWHDTSITREWNDPLKDINFCRDANSSTLFVLCEGKAIKGTVMVGEDGHRGWVYYLAVANTDQGKGYGRLLMDAAENWLRIRGVWKLNLLVRSDNHVATGFYDSIGYKDTNCRCFQKVLD